MQKQAEVLEGIGMPSAIRMRHATPHFAHVFAGDGYSSGYYSYMWSEVMDADAFAAFEEVGDAFDSEMAEKLERHILSAGGKEEAEALWKQVDALYLPAWELPVPEARRISSGLILAQQERTTPFWTALAPPPDSNHR